MITRDKYYQLLQEVSVASIAGDFKKATVLLNRVIREGTSAMKAYGFHELGVIKENQGLVSEARADWILGTHEDIEGKYTLCRLQHRLGLSYEREENVPETLSWYRAALKTCASGQEFSGQSVLTSFLRVNGGMVPAEDRDMVIQVIKKSRRVHEFPEETNLDDLPAAITKLEREFAELVERTIKESE